MKASIRFQPETDDFYKSVSARVDAYFKENGISKFANRTFWFITLLLISVYLILYFLVLFSSVKWVAFVSMIILGPLAILMGINIAHDAAHGSISRKTWVNELFCMIFDLVGANSYIWRKRHVFSHHSYPNIQDVDADLKPNPILRIFPHDPWRPVHKYQYIYAPFLYLVYTLFWLLIRDFSDFRTSEIGSLRFDGQPKKEVLKLWFFKSIYLGYIILLPILVSSLSWYEVLLGFFIMHNGASAFISLALVP